MISSRHLALIFSQEQPDAVRLHGHGRKVKINNILAPVSEEVKELMGRKDEFGNDKLKTKDNETR